MNEAVVILPDRATCSYTANCCEENTWKLCEHVKENNPDLLEKCFCVFISNDNKQFPLWKQKASHDPDEPVAWDYHVIFVYTDASSANVYDLDTTLTFPCDFKTYSSEAIGNDHSLKQPYRRKFRVIAAKEYLRTFASDRSHMRRSDGTWRVQPPQFPCIQTEMSTNNIQDFISMDASKGFGTVMDCTAFIDFFTRHY
ncbi:protein N-terminal glutamine amidohydrolase-like [Gigantopelta aegis]|uniref:protein N-terminal glutamine amidohydrolase-like n=1 Tax=Gigantopelta aegis TaxID=1735272 RepID=UPI001B887D7D|nr:protein N-terminal glutamine amidohydrolase-like [Gigantopelta aegis]